MECRWGILVATVIVLLDLMILGIFSQQTGDKTIVLKTVRGTKLCTKGFECTTASKFCCNGTISDYFESYQFEQLFSKRNTPVAHSVNFWDYRSFILASTMFQHQGFGTTGDKETKMKEVAAFFAFVGSKTSCGYAVATGGPYAWGLCYSMELSPNGDYCDDNFNAIFPCVAGVSYHGRGALPIFWNYKYGKIGKALNVDLLKHPEYIEQNATLAFQAAMVEWMTPRKIKQPSAHNVFVGKWKPSKNDTALKRYPGFGTVINVLYGEEYCGKGDNEKMDSVVGHYLYYLDLMGVGKDQAGGNLTCAEQLPFNPPSSSASS